MKKLILYTVIFIFCFSCRNEEDMSPNALFTPILKSERGDSMVLLTLENPTIYFNYIGLPTSVPDFYEILISEDGINFEILSEVSYSVGSLQVEPLNNKQVYYFKARAVKSGLESTTSNVIMTIPSEYQVPHPLYSSISADGEQYTPSPDGKLVTFVGKRASAGDNRSIYLNYFINETSVVKPIDEFAYNVGWNNQSDMIAYTKLINIDPNNYSYQFKVFDIGNDEEVFKLDFSQNSTFSRPVFSPDDSKLYYLEYEYLSSSFVFFIWELDLVTFQTNKIIQLPENEFIAESHLSISPDGKALILNGRIPDNSHNNIYRFDLNSLELSPLLQSAWDSRVPIISPDGKKMAFVANRTGEAEVWVQNLESNKLFQISGDISTQYDFSNSPINWLSESEIGFSSFSEPLRETVYTRYRVE